MTQDALPAEVIPDSPPPEQPATAEVVQLPRVKMKARPRRESPPRKRLLARGAGYEPLTADHFKYLWAAYKRGRFAMDEGMDPPTFAATLRQKAAELIAMGGDLFALMAKTPYGRIPVGLVTVSFVHPAGANPQLLPSALWFPEASRRNQLECVVKFIADQRKDHVLLIIAEPANWRFLEQVCRYGVLRAVGKLRNYWSDGTDAMVYEGVR